MRREMEVCSLATAHAAAAAGHQESRCSVLCWAELHRRAAPELALLQETSRRGRGEGPVSVECSMRERAAGGLAKPKNAQGPAMTGEAWRGRAGIAPGDAGSVFPARGPDEGARSSAAAAPVREPFPGVTVA